VSQHAARNLKRRYGLTVHEYDALSAAQDNRCAICGERESYGKAASKIGDGRKLCVDHCHATGAVRGLLCNHCNQGLGRFRDAPALLARALVYLLGHARPANDQGTAHDQTGAECTPGVR
jgi:hypothetical protein